MKQTRSDYTITISVEIVPHYGTLGQYLASLSDGREIVFASKDECNTWLASVGATATTENGQACSFCGLLRSYYCGQCHEGMCAGCFRGGKNCSCRRAA